MKKFPGERFIFEDIDVSIYKSRSDLCCKGCFLDQSSVGNCEYFVRRFFCETCYDIIFHKNIYK